MYLCVWGGGWVCVGVDVGVTCTFPNVAEIQHLDGQCHR